MATSEYLKILIDGQQLLLSENNKAAVTISYRLEDPEDFTRKKSSEALSITVPATVQNDQLGNTLYNPGVEDFTAEQVFTGSRPAVISAAGVELLVGRAFQVNAAHTDRPTNYEYDFYGNNGDWIIPLKEATLFDFLQHIRFQFTEQVISDSWAFDGRNEQMPYVFAPVRYRQPMDFFDADITDDTYKDAYITPLYMKPALSAYWIIYWAFKSIGYRLESNFFDTDYFRRLVMPWTWGNFLGAEGNRQDNLKFLAKSTEQVRSPAFMDGYLDVKASNDSSDGGFDANGVYTYIPNTGTMQWTYLPAFDYQRIEVTFNLQISWYVLLNTNNEIHVRVEWFLNGQSYPEWQRDIIHQSTGSQFGFEKSDIFSDYIKMSVVATDQVSVKVYVKGIGLAYTKIEVLQFTLTDIRIPLGGTIDFQNYIGLKNYKFLDFFAGIIDLFNLELGTDSITKTLTALPTHQYSTDDNPNNIRPGYFNGDFIDWSEKQDLRQQSTVELYRDYEREVTMKFRDDGNDGILKVVQDRNVTTLAAAKYVFPSRFKAEKKAIENRFFAATMHYEVPQWQNITTPGIKPQMICIIPENVANTSHDESQNTFLPKLAYYKGNIFGVGGWRYKTGGQVVSYHTFPFMFAVNYHPGGHNDPILSYSDEKIGNKIGRGLLRRFFLQRFSIMRNGRYYKTYFRLNNKDATNWLHREHKICRNQRWEMVEMRQYKPLADEPTECYLRRWVPVTEEDFKSVYPAMQNTLVDKFDIKYFPLRALVSDIPGPINK